MSESLSVILPVRNVEAELVGGVEQLLETVSELTRQLDMLIIDDGSTDNTEEVVMELCRSYPQLQGVRHSTKTGAFHAARVGFAKTEGHVVLIHDIRSPISGTAIRRLWAMRNETELMSTKSNDRQGEPAVSADRDSNAWSGTQMLRREALSALNEVDRGQISSERISRTDAEEERAAPNSMHRQFAQRKADAHRHR